MSTISPSARPMLPSLYAQWLTSAGLSIQRSSQPSDMQHRTQAELLATPYSPGPVPLSIVNNSSNISFAGGDGQDGRDGPKVAAASAIGSGNCNSNGTDDSSTSCSPGIYDVVAERPATDGKHDMERGVLETPPPDAEQVMVRRAALEARRAEAERHHHRCIWVKEPHGGPYRKAVSSRGPGASASSSSSARGSGTLAVSAGVVRPAEPGYEVVEVGPTTNFVGNAMSAGAVDLVMAQLEQLQNQTSNERPYSLAYAPKHSAVSPDPAPPAHQTPAPSPRSSSTATGSLYGDGTVSTHITTSPSAVNTRGCGPSENGEEVSSGGRSGGGGDCSASITGCVAASEFSGMASEGSLLAATAGSFAATVGVGEGDGEGGKSRYMGLTAADSEEARMAELRREARRLLGRLRGRGPPGGP
ncbi:hypothetical protein VOLCADRAFT_94363 [Volvox carteri f. nagariensis]|uniref:Uncharacterized protein n=1 Tax=Volvox carteri f. nagariensis TaxID=3068 RepID=D8U4L1_VOLCA|nr:uncharacterized protein VOLCADRAFT_94363 [Volvox carteri f. nagariensis]EFJ45209.1 hypothetical protein VOLCADRAFT_94363 [Volvox carteri f. nagariensis]|eukprot:XP_002953585.1 hypothetical protein VOLCADRAFT_94363 [Volvox carteri f. nagariensis]